MSASLSAPYHGHWTADPGEDQPILPVRETYSTQSVALLNNVQASTQVEPINEQEEHEIIFYESFGDDSDVMSQCWEANSFYSQASSPTTTPVLSARTSIEEEVNKTVTQVFDMILTRIQITILFLTIWFHLTASTQAPAATTSIFQGDSPIPISSNMLPSKDALLLQDTVVGEHLLFGLGRHPSTHPNPPMIYFCGNM
jgi:hypothetical protein